MMAEDLGFDSRPGQPFLPSVEFWPALDSPILQYNG